MCEQPYSEISEVGFRAEIFPSAFRRLKVAHERTYILPDRPDESGLRTYLPLTLAPDTPTAIKTPPGAMPNKSLEPAFPTVHEPSAPVVL